MTLTDPLAATAPVPFLDLRAVHARYRDALDEVWQSVLAHGKYVGGPEVGRFERDFASYCGANDCVGVANGTDAIELILRGLGIGPGDEVVVPTNTFVATAEAVAAVGATSRFVDVDPGTLLIDVDAASAAIGPATAAVIAVHLFGQMAPMAELVELTRRHGIALIEDAAQAHGARYDGRRAGGAGAVAAAFSFYPGKNLGALGDGGAVVSDDAALVARVRELADHGRRTGDRHHHDHVGRNSRLDTLQAGLLSARLPWLDGENEARREVLAHYGKFMPDAYRLVSVDPRAEPVHHLAVVRTDRRDEVAEALTEHAIGWGVHYKVPCHLQPAFSGSTPPGALPVAERAATEILSLPCSPTTTAAEVERVCDVLRSVR